MFASSRCSPQVGSRLGDAVCAPFIGVSWSTLAPPAEEHWARYALGSVLHTVEGIGCLSLSSKIPAAIDEPGANGALGKIRSPPEEPRPVPAGSCKKP